jgi:glucose-6-phosphate isomerase
MSSLLDVSQLVTQFDPSLGTIGDAPQVKRHLSDLRGCFCDAKEFERAIAHDDPLVYTVAAMEPAAGDGDLHYGLGVIYPGLVGDEYFLTKGHLHSWRGAAELYIGLAGEGVMLLEDEATGESRLVPLQRHGVVYVPGHTAHRTVNTSDVPLTYLGVYPAQAGHDYDAIAERNFRSVVIQRDGKPHMIERN